MFKKYSSINKSTLCAQYQSFKSKFTTRSVVCNSSVIIVLKIHPGKRHCYKHSYFSLWSFYSFFIILPSFFTYRLMYIMISALRKYECLQHCRQIIYEIPKIIRNGVESLNQVYNPPTPRLSGGFRGFK